MDALIRHIQYERGSLHIPGHKQGRVGLERFFSFLDRGLALDLTELPGLDNFHHAQGCILRSQQLAAAAYGSDTCLYSVNGSTAAVMAAIKAVAEEEDVVVMAGPFHASAWRGLVWSGARPQLGQTRFDARRQVTLPPTPAEVGRWLDEGGDAVKAVFLTSPIYQGLAADVAAIAEVVHARGLPLIVDEAHGAHFGLPGMPPNSVAAGADVVIHSVHKMLPGLTQTAWVHVQGGRVDPHRLAEELLFLHSTSPSYLLLASIDAARAWREEEGAAAAEATLARLAEFGLLPDDSRAQDALTEDRFWVDPLRHWLPTGEMAASRRLADRLATRGLFVEYADAQGVLAVFGLGVRERTLARYREALDEWQAEEAAATAAHVEPFNAQSVALSEPVLVLSPRAAAAAAGTTVAVSQAAGRIAKGLIVPYPPGVPLIYPGQRIDVEHCERLAALLASGYDVQGVTDAGEIPVVC
ncbi:aminotransferase class I/II-fold pyridoxal phosphate-dependent enzyme [Alicyclobacillus herbarius]|uniref:aminotransferase class I/II-fold pyridoxal phosphate-dependent enzyme n=1 Tax=Alicyclobacillus herbarius TaxID=122960 RepID=UPI00235800AD|nr:aminotransferase class I/II-fold pyridoxal phosphate-dependent enzyme [Alicyclobacillus herbarius]